MKTVSIHLPLAFLISVAAMLSGAGCANIPAAVKISADNVRTNVQTLHGLHAKDVRALAAAECILKEDGQAVRQAFREKMEADIAASKTRVLAQFDRRAGDVLGAEFQTRLQSDVYPKFAGLEQTNFHALVLALQKKITYPDNPGVSEDLQAAQRNLDNVRFERDNTVSYYFIALSSALNRARFNFETQVEQEYGLSESNVITIVSSLNATNQDLISFNTNMDLCLQQLDDAYNQLDQALSDLSTDLDSSAVTTRMVKSFFTGVGSALVDDLKNGQLGAAALSQLLNSQAPGLVKQLNGIESKMLTQADQSVTNAVNSVSTPAPKTTL